jgi:spermidine/putrescine transport system substrate-binding protein/spermidine/putrescine transport system permease protein
MSVRNILLKIWVVCVYIFLFAPILTVVIMSFYTSKYSTFPLGDLTLQWYKLAVTDQNIISAIKNSFIISLAATFGATCIGTLAAMGFVRQKFRGKETLNAFFLSPMIIPEIITGIALLSFATMLKLKGGFFLIVIGHILICLPFVVTVVSARLHGFDRSLEEAAMDLGASETITFRRITLPLILPGILGGALLAFTVSFDNFLITYMLAGPGMTTIPIQVYSMVRFEITPKIHAFSTFIVLISMTLIIINERVIRAKKD